MLLPSILVLVALSGAGRSSPLEPQTVVAQPLPETQVLEETKETLPEQPREPPSPTRDARAFDNEVNQKLMTPASEETLMTKLNAKCSQRDTSSCLMLKLVTYMNRLLKKSSIGVGDSLVITQTSAVVQEESPLSRSLQQDASEESQLGMLVANKLWNFVRSRSIKWSVLPEADLVMSASPDDEGTLKLGMNIRAGKALETGRGKMKNMGPVIAAGIMKIGMMGVLAFKALALLVGKALLVSKLAFLLAAVIGLKKLFSQERHVTYEVVAHPHHSHSEVHSSGHHGGGDSFSSGWGRSLGGDAHTLAYRAQMPKSPSS